jgi:hypothetical protein
MHIMRSAKLKKSAQFTMAMAIQSFVIIITSRCFLLALVILASYADLRLHLLLLLDTYYLLTQPFITKATALANHAAASIIGRLLVAASTPAQATTSVISFLIMWVLYDHHLGSKV